ncbi:respiratory chain complex I subunit 1 family protein [Leptolinea tardivitalis]|uniref:2-hydroxyacid dehydrogenase n=1 Tax=Leptolinea tardivitalis TaxID=229920 RepID=A0A0P6XM05_9CHLR|nr:complex I subunit 1 family protein [Leptolinea tardivitalis]KPL72907.1 2-hydroxyacid dehydrogenase [Leptolinea tardivitalis]GAP20705.1 formate hydrogenlyase subunit 4 [Leptolinea tardivitalis]
MNNWWINAILALLFWPGLLSGALFGWFLLWMSRKFIARLQGRQGPPFYQPFFDFWKLIGKKTIIPNGVNPVLFYALPIIGLISIIFALALLPVPGSSGISFEGDLVLLIYLIEMPVLMDVIAGYVTRSVYAQVGATREAILTIAYNLPFLGALIALAVRLHSFKLATFAAAPISIATILAAVALFVALLAQLKVNPFSIPNAEQEIVAGIHVEYNGLPLALFELTHALETSLLVGLISILFIGPFTSIWMKLLIFFVVAVVVILLTNITAAGTARLKVQHAFKFYWTWGIAATVLVVAAALIL